MYNFCWTVNIFMISTGTSTIINTKTKFQYSYDFSFTFRDGPMWKGKRGRVSDWSKVPSWVLFKGSNSSNLIFLAITWKILRVFIWHCPPSCNALYDHLWLPNTQALHRQHHILSNARQSALCRYMLHIDIPLSRKSSGDLEL